MRNIGSFLKEMKKRVESVRRAEKATGLGV